MKPRKRLQRDNKTKGTIQLKGISFM